MGIKDIFKEAVKLVQQIDNIPLKEMILALQKETSDLVQQLGEKDETIEKLKAALEPKGNRKFEHSAYWLKDDEGKITGGPFCQNCFDNRHDYCCLVHVGKPSDQAGHNWEWVQCPECSITFRQKKVGIYLNTH